MPSLPFAAPPGGSPTIHDVLPPLDASGGFVFSRLALDRRRMVYARSLQLGDAAPPATSVHTAEMRRLPLDNAGPPLLMDARL
jgi:hypothetical protein